MFADHCQKMLLTWKEMEQRQLPRRVGAWAEWFWRMSGVYQAEITATKCF